jgi:hypothetical protein
MQVLAWVGILVSLPPSVDEPRAFTKAATTLTSALRQRAHWPGGLVTRSLYRQILVMHCGAGHASSSSPE